MANVFDKINEINSKNNYGFTDEDEKIYNTYIVNKAFSYFRDTIFYANECNKYSNMSSLANYNFYYYALPKGKRFSKWHKKEQTKDEIDFINSVSNYYEVNKIEAEKIVNMLVEDELKILKERLNKGGV